MKINWLKSYFYTTLDERKNMEVFMGIIIFFALLPRLVIFFLPAPKSLNFEEIAKENAKIQAILSKNDKTKEDLEKSMAVFEPFPFNPNTASKEELTQLGLSDKVINTISNYRSKGGKFYKPEDFSKIWGLQKSDYTRLKDYINIDTPSKNNFAQNDKTSNKIPNTQIEYFIFDPNTATVDEFMRLGITEKTANIISNYRAKGGKFRKPEDFQKIYSISPETFAKISPYIVIQTVPNNNNTIASSYSNPQGQTPSSYSNQTSFKKVETSNINIDLNTATEEDFMKLKGIGAGYAKRIVNYRNKLGGFYSIEQVKETYGFPDSVFQKIKLNLTISPITKKININTATPEDLKLHPYLKWSHVNLIESYKKAHGGKIQDAQEFYKLQGIPKEVADKIIPYLSF
jgi:competence ComEA-like helix-hairpin-helix protein